MDTVMEKKQEEDSCSIYPVSVFSAFTELCKISYTPLFIFFFISLFFIEVSVTVFYIFRTCV